MRTSVPSKNPPEIIKYIQNLIPNVPAEIAEIISMCGPKNLRQIKRFLNNASFLASTGKEKFLKYELAVIWVLFEFLMLTNQRAITIAIRMPYETGHSFIKWLCDVLPEDPQQCKSHLTENAAFRLASGVPSHNDEHMYQLLRKTRELILKNGGFSTQVEDSFNEILLAAEESID